MKKSIVLFLLVIIGAKIKAQPFSAQNMVMYATTCKNVSCFKDLIVQHGFTYEKMDEGSTMYVYRFPSSAYDYNGNPNLKDVIKSMITFDIHKTDDVRAFSYTTINSSNCDKLIADFKSLKYSITDVVKTDDGIITKYESDLLGYPVMTAKIQPSTFNGEKFTFYKITVYAGKY